MKVFFTSLGCDKTLSDSEHILGSLLARGMELTDDPGECDLYAINTCCFIHDALEESIEAVIEAGRIKPEGARLAVFGCMAVRYYEDILDKLPEADIVIPHADPEKVCASLSEHLAEDVGQGRERTLTGPGYSAVLKIAEGCSKHCTYCVIPSIRGSYRSLPKESLLAEAAKLSGLGVKELILVAQETTLYGVDLYGEKSLHSLIREISLIEGIEWIRLMYAYPEEIYPELIREMADNPKVLHYIDMPLQHISDTVLGRMGRRTNEKSIRDIIKRLKEAMPDIAIRTTFISGFPGETEEDHAKLMDFVAEGHLKRVGVFTYSREENTPAYDMEQVPPDIAQDWADELMELSAEISGEKNEALLGSTLRCMVEGYLPEEDIYQGRSYMDAPDIDSLVFFKSDYPLMSGDFATVRVTACSDYDLIGEIYESAE